MPHVRGRVLPVALAAVVLVGGANLAAYAANGHPLLLGAHNTESKTATVTNTAKGAALSLSTSKQSPPLQVNSTKVVKHLNADAVDGQSAKDLATNVITYNIPGGTSVPFSRTLNGLPKGSYLASLVVAMNSATPARCFLTDGTAPAC